ncbi:hypothetical protein ACF3N7_07310 [Cruoricaptor ignavus]|uniref:hypothetical protein n=1 Tax=Cruoricaptor ignavus TaxID=1118202 RepID=UPI00370D3995
MVKNYSLLFKSLNTSNPPQTIALEKRANIKFTKLQISFKKVGLIVILAISMQAYSQLYIPNGVVNTSSNGNVGIGTNNPQESLDVNGRLRINGGADSFFGFGSSTSSTPIDTRPAYNAIYYPYVFNWHTGLTFSAHSIYGGIRFYNQGYPEMYGTADLVMSITENKVGIGTKLPRARLHVLGNIKSSMSTNEGGNIVLENPLKTANSIANKWTIYNMTGGYGNSLQFWNYSLDGSMYGARLIISDSGNVSIPSGKLEAREVKVTTTPTADFVFAEDYQLPTLENVEKHIKDKKHLPEIASAEQMQKEGVNVGEFQIKLLQKIEELTLYSIEQNKKITEQNKQISEQNKKISEQQNQLQSQEQRIKHLENQLSQKP